MDTHWTCIFLTQIKNIFVTFWIWGISYFIIQFLENGIVVSSGLLDPGNYLGIVMRTYFEHNCTERNWNHDWKPNSETATYSKIDGICSAWVLKTQKLEESYYFITKLNSNISEYFRTLEKGFSKMKNIGKINDSLRFLDVLLFPWDDLDCHIAKKLSLFHVNLKTHFLKSKGFSKRIGFFFLQSEFKLARTGREWKGYKMEESGKRRERTSQGSPHLVKKENLFHQIYT